MIVGIKDLTKLLAISVIACCAVFVCTLFLNYNLDLAGIKEEITTQQEIVIYQAQISMGKVIAAVSGGCLLITSVVMLLFYIKNYIDTHGKELGILKALGYSDFKVAKYFWVFGLSIFLGCALGYIGGSFYMPTFYELQNSEQILPELLPQFHIWLAISFIALPTAFFICLSVMYAFCKMKSPVLHLLREMQEFKFKISKKQTKDLLFLQELKKTTVRSRKILIFFVGFSAFCFSAMTQMSMSMEDLGSEHFTIMLISIGLILSFMTLLLSLSSVMKANKKTLAMMKVFGYSQKECSKALLSGYRPVSYIGFTVGTLYQYILLKVAVTIIFADYENTLEYGFHFQSLIISLICFIAAYELIIYFYSQKINRLSVKEIMLD